MSLIANQKHRVLGPRHRRPPQQAAALARRAGWNVGDQILSAVTNVVMSFLVARAVDARGFGAYSVAFVVFSVLVGAERSLVGQPLAILHTQAEDMKSVLRGASGTALALGVVSGLGSILIGFALGGIIGESLISVGVVLPGLLMQDCCRMIFFADRRPILAALNDGVWAVLQFSAMAVILIMGVDSLAPYVLAWGLSACVAAAVGVKQLGVLPDVRRAHKWVAAHRKLSGYLIAEYILGTGAYQSGIFLIGAFAGVQSVGSLRAAQVLIGPVSLIGTAMMTFALPELSRRKEMAPATRVKVAVVLSGAMSAIVAVYGAILLLFPNDLGTKLLGDTWTGAHSVLLPVILGSIFLATCSGPGIMAYAMGHARVTFHLHLVETPVLLTSIIIGVQLDGVRGAAWGMALTFALMSPLTAYRVFRIVYPSKRAAGRATETVVVPDELELAAETVEAVELFGESAVSVGERP